MYPTRHKDTTVNYIAVLLNLMTFQVTNQKNYILQMWNLEFILLNPCVQSPTQIHPFL